jgi:hypothetical protein
MGNKMKIDFVTEVGNNIQIRVYMGHFTPKDHIKDKRGVSRAMKYGYKNYKLAYWRYRDTIAVRQGIRW